jgi:hypothetical protein
MEAGCGQEKKAAASFLQGDKNNAWTQLGYAEIAGVEQPPFGGIAQFSEVGDQARAIVVKHRIEQAAHVFQHHRARAAFVYQA